MIKTLPQRIFSYFVEVKNEVEKIAWPTQKTTLLYGAFVFGACIVVAFYSGILDFALTKLVNILLAR